jgi:hypothetical protein
MKITFLFRDRDRPVLILGSKWVLFLLTTNFTKNSPNFSILDRHLKDTLFSIFHALHESNYKNIKKIFLAYQTINGGYMGRVKRSKVKFFYFSPTEASF